MLKNIEIVISRLIPLFLVVVFAGCGTQLPQKNSLQKELSPVSFFNDKVSAQPIYDKEKVKIENFKNPSEVKIPVLMFHSIQVNGKNSLVINPVEFSKQMDWIVKNNYTTLSMEDIYMMLTTGKNVPEKPIALTFDDGYEDNYFNAFPVLKEKNLKATVFLITDNIGERGFLKADQIKEMYKNNVDFQSHTASHKELNLLSYNTQVNEMKRAKSKIEALIHNNTNVLCYPVGKYSETTITAAKDAGYRMCFTTKYGFSKCSDGLYTLTRVRMFPGMNLESIKRN